MYEHIFRYMLLFHADCLLIRFRACIALARCIVNVSPNLPPVRVAPGGFFAMNGQNKIIIKIMPRKIHIYTFSFR